jgi:hypothetical protein
MRVWPIANYLFILLLINAFNRSFNYKYITVALVSMYSQLN